MNQPSSSPLFPFVWTWFLLLEQFVCHFSIFIISCLNRFCFDSLVTPPSSGTFHLLFMLYPYLPTPSRDSILLLYILMLIYIPSSCGAGVTIVLCVAPSSKVAFTLIEML